MTKAQHEARWRDQSCLVIITPWVYAAKGPSGNFIAFPTSEQNFYAPLAHPNLHVHKPIFLPAQFFP